MTSKLVKSAAAQGLRLVGIDGAKLGTVREVYLDLGAGTIEFLAIEAASLLGGASKFHPVPWRVIRYDETGGDFRVEVDKETFKASPSYDRDQLANANYGWGEQVTLYFASDKIAGRKTL